MIVSEEDHARLDVDLARQMSLAEFVQQSWHVLEPTTPLVWGWHMQALADHVEDMLLQWVASQGGGPPPSVQNAIFNVPPGSSKSRIVSVCAPAWLWIRYPSARIQAVSANPRVAVRDSGYCRDLILSDWYQDTFKPDWQLKDDANTKTLYLNTAGGHRAAWGALAKITGARADLTIYDDLIDARDRNSIAKREAINDWLAAAAFSRVNDEHRSLRIMIGQRLHQLDPPGFMLTTLPDKWHVLIIPQEWEEDQRRTSWMGWTDPRTVDGELMCEARFDREAVRSAKLLLGAAGYAGQHQQRPSAAVGNLFRRAWLVKRWTPETLPPYFQRVWISADCANELVPTSWVVVQCWGSSSTSRYLLDQRRDRVSPLATEQMIRDGHAQWVKRFGRVDATIVEKKAAGPAVIERLRLVLLGVTPWPPKGVQMSSKEERAAAVSPQIEAGNVWLPDPGMPGYAWVAEYVEELVNFPNAGADDQVDCTTQALQYGQGMGAHALKLGDDFVKRGQVPNRWKMR